MKLELAEKNHRQLEGMYDSNWDELQSLKEENSVAIKDRNESRLDIAYLLEYKRKYYNLVIIMIVVGIISILGFALWSVL